MDMTQIKVQMFEPSNIRGASIVYAAPEALFRFRNRTNESYDALWKASDTYSFAICIWQMLTRQSPWKS